MRNTVLIVIGLIRNKVMLWDLKQRQTLELAILTLG